MPKNPPDHSDWTSLPVLTEIVGDVPPEIPTLTEEALNKQLHEQEGGVQEMSAAEIAALLAPQLEKQLREKLSARFESMWQETWQQTRASLPDLIRAQLTLQSANKGLSGSKEPGLDIIAPRSASAGTRKSTTGKASATKPDSKEPKN